jgi:uncharacterized protein (DUF433 family)
MLPTTARFDRGHPVAKTKKKPIPEQNPVEVPLYTPWDVARYLRVPLWAVSALTGRFRGWPEPEFFFRYFWRELPRPFFFDDDLAMPPGYPEDQSRISFRRFADLFIRAGILQTLVDWPQYGEKRLERRENLHHAIWRGLEDTSREAVPFDISPAEERADRLAEPFSRHLDERQAALIRKHLTLRLDRVETKDEVPIRIYPPTRDPADKSPRNVVLDPRVRFGRPTLAGRGVPTDSLFERYQAGDSVAMLVKDYDLTTGEVEEAIRYESRLTPALLPFPGW